MEYTQSASHSVPLLLTQVVAVCILSSPVIFATTDTTISPETTISTTTVSTSVTSTVSTTTQINTSTNITTTDSATTASSSTATSSPTPGSITTTDSSTTSSSAATNSSTTGSLDNNSSNATTGSSTTDSSTTDSSTTIGSFTTTGSSTTDSSTTNGSSTTTDSSTTGSSTTNSSITTGSSTTTGSSITSSTNATHSSTSGSFTGSSTGDVTTPSPTTTTANGSTTTLSSTSTTFSIPTTSTTVTTTSTTQTSPASSSQSDNEQNKGGIIAAIVILVIAIVVAVSLFVFFWKRRNQQLWCKTRTRYRSTKVPRKRMKVKYFAQYLGVLHKDSGLLFQEQFEELQKNSPRTYSYDAALADENKIKNRYVNIVPYDHTRVKLTVDSEVGGSDFINASYVPGYSSPREYIATQGPLTSTADDFWRMIWEQKSGVIVMLSDLHEKGRRKVDKYWPDEANSPERFGDITVELTSVTTCKCYIIRHFKISEDTQEERMVLQFFIPGWEDHGANLSPDDILSFIQAVRLEARTREGPITVHCSAGVGRTGTFIALDFLMQFVEENGIEEEVDIYNLVLNMRHSRPNMVQSEKQYIFIHDVLKIIIDRKMKHLAGSNGVHDDDNSAVVNLAFAAASSQDPDEANGEAAELCSTRATSL